MDPNTLLSSSGSGSGSGSHDDDPELCNKLWMFLLVLATVCFSLYMLFAIIQEVGRIKFSIEPIVYTGLDDSGMPPSFNVTLHAESTHYGWDKFCSSGPTAMEVAYSGMAIAMADAEPFCVDARGEKLITATASPGWAVLPAFLQERMDSDRRHGGVQMEVGFVFNHDDGLATWVRCTTTLDHHTHQASPCDSYFVRGCH